MTPTDLLERAIRTAQESHDGQHRKASGLPYIVHPIEVMKRLSDLGVDRERGEHVLCAAALHDVLEDTDITSERLRDAFPMPIAGIVEELTFDPDVQSKAEYMDSFTERSVEALVVKLVDRACNVGDFLHSNPKYGRIYAGKARALYAAVLARHEEIVGAFGSEAAARLRDEAVRLLDLAE